MEVYETPKHYTPPTDKEIWKYQNENIGDETSISKSEKLKHKKRISERKRINNRFFKNPKQVYRSMKGNNIIVEKLPEKKAVEKFWKDV